MPVISQPLARLGEPIQVEREFFSSLSNLGSLYGFSVTDTCTTDYPFNIAQAFERAQKQMKKIRPDLDVIIVKDEAQKCCIATVKTFDTGTWLYYIPVKPLHQLLNDRKTKRQGNLLLSVFSYLYQIVGIPYFTQGYLSDVYDMIQDWLTCDPSAFDADDFACMLEEYRAMEYFGNRLFRSIKHPYHLLQFENRVDRFKAITENDAALFAIGKKLLSLYKQYPSRSIFDNCKDGLLGSGEDEQIMLHQYVSFFWDSKGMVYEQVMESVNAYFQEAASIEEPTTVQLFDTPQQEERHDLDFEQRLFACICELNEYLNEA